MNKIMEIIDNGKENTILLPKNLENLNLVIEGNNNKVEIQENVKIFKELHIRIENNNSKVIIGKNTTIFNANILVNEDNNKVEIGEDCMLSRNVRILASDSHSIIDKASMLCVNYHKTGIKIGNHVWLGMNTMILKDSQIGDNSVVAAGAIVTNKENLENVVLAGNPARVIRTNITWERKTPEYIEAAKKVKLDISKPEKEDIEYIDECDLKSKKEIRKLSGWAYVKNIDSSKSEIYFEIKSRISEIYKAQTYKREDISKSFGEQYKMAGFNIIFPLDIKLKKVKEINLVIKNEEKIYKKQIWKQSEEVK